MAVYTCPHAAHKGNPVPLAENAEGVFACVVRHRFVVDEDAEMGHVFRDLSTGILYEMHPFDVSVLHYRPEKEFTSKELKQVEVDLGHGNEAPTPKPQRKSPAQQKKVRKISTTSIPFVHEGLNFNALNLSPLEWKIIARVDGISRIKDIIEACRIEPKEAYDTLGSLIKRGIIGIRES